MSFLIKFHHQTPSQMIFHRRFRRKGPFKRAVSIYPKDTDQSNNQLILNEKETKTQWFLLQKTQSQF